MDRLPRVTTIPLFSIFTPFGALAFSSKPSRVQAIYDAMIANLNERPNENFDISPGTNIEAMVYARARTQAMARYTLDRAFNNAQPGRATETLPIHEKEFEVVPGPHDSLADRRRVVAARALLPGGAGYINVTNALTTLLGTGFINFRLTPESERINFPTVGGTSPGNFVVPLATIKQITITGVISVGLGSPQFVLYQPWNPAEPVSLLNGDSIVVDPKIYGITERVTIGLVTPTSFSATFNKAHDAGTFATTAPYPFWRSSRRHSLVIVTRATAENNDKRRQINELLSRLLKATDSWDIVPDLDGSHTAPIKTDDAVLGRVHYGAVGSLTYP